MDYEFQFQDPTSRATVYLQEAIIDAVQGATHWRSVFAFVTRNGVQTLLTDPMVEAFLERGRLELIVGIDAVTNRDTLEYLAGFERDHANFTVRVFWNQTAGLFHPKISHFRYPNRREVLIVGSGNLTPGGLQDNFEGYTVIRSRAREAIEVPSLDEFIRGHQQDIRPIDDEILARAARNVIVGGGRRGGSRRRRPIEIEPEMAEAAAEAVIDEQQAPVRVHERVLVARVPRAGGRWHQVHFNHDVIDQFFQVSPNSTQRVYVVARRADGSAAEQEVRPCVYSRTNRNYKIELGARRDEEYPEDGIPIALFRELHARSFEYMLIFPNEAGYEDLYRLTEELPSVGKGLRRTITDTATLAQTWPQCPLVEEAA
jgi:HKD family nuclease